MNSFLFFFLFFVSFCDNVDVILSSYDSGCDGDEEAVNMKFMISVGQVE